MTKSISKSNFIKVVEILAVIALSLSQPITLSFDSYLYISSAFSLFNHDFSNWYHFLREPGYPLLLKSAYYLLGSNLYLFGIVQSLLMFFGIKAFFRTFANVFSNRKLNIFTYVSFLAMCGYGNAILQQASIIFIVGLTTYVLRNVSSNRIVFTVIFPALGILTMAISVLVGSMYLLAFILTLFFDLVDKRKIKLALRRFIATFFVSILFLSGWYGIKASTDSSNNRFQDVKYFWDYKYDSDSAVVHLSRALETVGGLISATPEVYGGKPQNPAAAENKIFGVIMPSGDLGCARKMNGPAGVVEYVNEQVVLPEECNTNNSFLIMINKVSRFLFPIFPLGILLLPTAMKHFGIRMRQVFVPLVFLLPYLIAGVGISRLGLPTMLLAPFGLNFIYEKFRDSSLGRRI